ncbi:GerAB/ArcD/ProY family transporter [Paenibacillus ihbetae]|uniref:Spore gernimation protein n=1 Tax=Paenibacillus ihbetae TaxID=1870820 RepID=A0A1B2DTV1_9BACL|nr:endospore germination permease [Paenibacillus ihbetae]ANY71131.1 spore gernimation protein [Paenibacillus ihbetae]OOC61495.1 spore gernimation protein [Paenibacillus ihbetae]
MNNQRQITVLQASAVTISTIVGVGVLALPLAAVRAADAGAPLVTFLGMLLAFIGLFFMTRLGMRFPNDSYIQYSEVIMGRWLGMIGSLISILFFAVLCSLVAREFGEVVVTAVLKNTPLEVTVLVMLLLAAFSSRKNIMSFAYIHLFYSPFMLIPALLIVALSLKNADIINVLPVWGNDPSGIPMGIITLSTVFQGYFIMMMVIPAMSRPEKAMRASIWAMLVTGLLYTLIVIATVGLFGAEETKTLLWPTLELAKATSLPANVLERLDAVFLAVWVTAVFTSLFSCYYFTIYSISKLLKLADQGMLSFFILPILFVLAMLPQSLLELNELNAVISKFGLLITIVYPGMLLVIAKLRKKRGASR